MKKRKTAALLSGFVSACVLACVPAAGMMTASAADDIVYGDANCDNNVNMADAVIIMQSLASPSAYGIDGTNAEHITKEGKNRGDVSNRGDGITNKDALAIQKKLLRVINELPESYDGNAGGENSSTSSTQTTTATTTETTASTTVTTTDEEESNIKAEIKLNGSSITAASEYVTVDGSTATITHSGTFTISGTLDNGQICVNIPDETTDKGTVKLVFNGISITGKNAPAILVKNADKTSITLADGTENTLSDGDTAYSGDWQDNAIIEAKDDLTIKGGDEGTGKLTITANTQTAVVCNNDIKITGGDITINTENKTDKNDAVKGKKSVTVKGGKLNINAEGDGLKSSKGSVEIAGGEIAIKCGNDAIQAETGIKISGGAVAACGDKGLTCPENVEASITGGEVLITSTDAQSTSLTNVEQNTMMLDFTKEWTKNNPISVTDSSNNVLFELNTPKKFKYAIVSSSKIGDSECKVFAGGIKMKHSTGSTFKAGKPAVSYTDVNNDMENEEQLYSPLFSQSTIHKIDVQMDEGEWNNLLKNASKEEWTPCDVTIDGENFKNVAIRTKGNSSLMMAKNGKYSFRIKMDKYDKSLNYHGLTELCMNNMLSDASCLRDILCYNAMYEIDGVAPQAAHTDMYLNGNLYSFYLLAEQPGTTLAERYAVDDDSVLYKATEKNDGAGMNMFGGDGYCSFTENMPLDRFDVKFGTDDDFSHIQEVKTAINQLTSDNYKFIEDVIDVPSFLKGFAVNSIFCNYDSYNGSLAHNYYLMYSGGKTYFVGWDYNLCLGNFTGGAGSVTSDITTSLYQANITDRPLAKLLQVPEYYDMYVDIVNDILNYYSDPEQYVAQYAANIRSHVQADPRFSFTLEDFDKNTSKSAEGLQVSDNGGNNGGWPGFGGDNGGNNGGWPGFGGDNGGNNGGWPGFGGDNGGQQGGWQGFGGDNGGQQGGWQGFGGDNGGQQGGWQGFGGDNGGQQGGWPGFGGDASMDWGNMDWGNMDFGNMDWGNMDFGGFDFGGGMFGGGQTSVVDFLIKRFEIIRSKIN